MSACPAFAGIYTWSAPVPFNGLTSSQILTTLPGTIVGAVGFGNPVPVTVTLAGNTAPVVFGAYKDPTVASVTASTALTGGTGAYPAATANTTGNTGLNAVLNTFASGSGPFTIKLINLTPGATYSVQLFSVDDRPSGSGQASFQDPADNTDVSSPFTESGNSYIVGTFTVPAGATSVTLQENLPAGGGVINALVVRAVSFTPPINFTLEPLDNNLNLGDTATFSALATGPSPLVPQWQSGPAGGPYTNLTDGGRISGSKTYNLTISNITAADASVQYVLSLTSGTSSVSSRAANLSAYGTSGPFNVSLLPGANVNLAILQCYYSGGGIVTLGPGTYYGGVNMYPNVTLKGAGMGVTTIVGTLTQGQYGNNMMMQDLTVSGGISASSYSQGGYPSAGIFFGAYYPNNSSNLSWKNVEVKGTNIAMQLINVSGCTLTGCNFHDNGLGFSHTIYFTGDYAVSMNNCIASWGFTGAGAHLDFSSDIGVPNTFTQCEFNGSTGNGILNQAYNGSANPISITGCKIQYCGQSGGEGSGVDTDGGGSIVSSRLEYNHGNGATIRDSVGLFYDIINGNSTAPYFSYAAVAQIAMGTTPNVYTAASADGVSGVNNTADWVTNLGGATEGAVAFTTGSHAVNGSITWPNVSAPGAGSYPLQISYANGSSNTLAMPVTVNGTYAGTMLFPPTGGWSTYGSTGMNATLTGSNNSVRLDVLSPGLGTPVLNALTVNAPAPATPGAVTGLTGAADRNAPPGDMVTWIDLSWNPAPGATDYDILRNGLWIATGVSTNSFIDKHVLGCGATETYTVVPVNTSGGGQSASVTAVSLAASPLNASASGVGNDASVSWTASPGALYYNVYRSTTSGGPYTYIGSSTATSYLDTTVTLGTTYYYIVRAYNGLTESLNSPETAVTPSTPYAGNPVLIDVDFGSGATQSGTAVLGSAGDKWNAVAATTGTLVNSTNSTLSGVGLNLSSYGVYTDAGGTTMDAATSALMQDYAFGYSSTPNITVNLTGLSAYRSADFTLVVYAAGDTPGQGASVSLTGGASGGNTGSALVVTGSSRSLSAGPGVGYTTFTGTLTGGTLSIVASPLSGQAFTCFNGFQLRLSPRRPPTIAAVPPQSTFRGQMASLQISGSDPQGLPLTYIATGLPTGLAINSTGLISGTVGASAAASNAVNVTVSDGVLTASTSFNWSIATPAPPTISPVTTQSTFRGQAVNLQIAASDPNGLPLTYSATGLPAGLAINATGLISGTVSTSAAASNAVTVTVSDGILAASASFTWNTVAPNPPTIAAVGAQSAFRGQTARLQIAASDPNGLPLTYSATGLPAGLAINATGLISGIVSTSAAATNPATVTVSDGLLSASVSFTWTTSTPNPPTITAVGAQNTFRGQTARLQIAASDPNGLPLTYSATGLPAGLAINAAGLISGTISTSAAATNPVTVTVSDGILAASTAFTWTTTTLSPPTIAAVTAQSTTRGKTASLQIAASDPNGLPLTYSATGLPAGLAINASGLISGTVSSSAAASYAVTVTVSDGFLTASTSFAWSTSALNPPTIGSVSAQSTIRGETASLQIAASDPNGQPLTYSATNLPTGLTINASGLISGTVSASAAASNAVTVTVSDGTLTASASFAWATTAPGAPVIGAVPAQSTLTGQTASLQITASDPNGLPLTYSATGLPAGLTISPSGLISGTVSAGAAASNAVTVTVSDGLLSTSASFTWTIAIPAAASLTGTDIGAPPIAGSNSYTGGVYTVSGCGSDIWGTSDQFHYVSQTLVGDGQIIARVTSQTDTHPWAKAGVMFRETLGATSRFAALELTPGNGATFQYRTATAGSCGYTTGASAAAPNNWVCLVRVGNLFTGYRSSDGVAWTPVGSATIPMASSVTVGLCVCSVNTAALSTATFDNVQDNTLLSGADIGAPGLTGSNSYAPSAYTVTGGGADIWNTSDQFHYVSQTLTGDGQIIARVPSQTNTNPWAKAGVMFRETVGATSRFAAMELTPGNGTTFQYRTATAGSCGYTTGASAAAPNNWVCLVRVGNLFTGYRSSDGVTWTPVGSATIPMASSVTVGLCVSAHDNTQLSTATFDHVQYNTLLSGADIGAPGLTGSNSYVPSIYTVSGGGADIWNTSDQFHYLSQTLTGDGQIIARVPSQTNTNPWAKAGAMFRETLNANSTEVAMMLTPGNGTIFQYRATTGANCGYSSGASAAAPNNWVRLTRAGNVFTGYGSTDGVTWTQVGTVTVSMAPSITFGLAVSAHDNTMISTATFDNVQHTP
jgi:regulation of enolase protein 1 (concanavalin A-like superfamily)